MRKSPFLLPQTVGSSFLLFLCFSVLLSDATLESTQISDEASDTSKIIKSSNQTSNGTLNIDSSVIEEDNFNVTEHRGFVHGFVEALSVILVSELGDKTFFIAAILAMRNNKLTVFLAAIAALAVMTVLSALLGFVVTTFIPRAYTYYTCTAIMALFGIKMLWEAWRMKPNEGEETQREVEEELARRGSTPSLNQPAQDSSQGQDEETRQLSDVEAVEAGLGDSIQTQEVRGKSLGDKMREKSWFGKKCVKIFRVFSNTFAMTFLAEWGDRSQLATIVMAGINDVGGVCVGGVLGHIVCTGLAVICGALIAKKISVRMVTLTGALIFLGFAVASLFIDPYEENHLVPDVEVIRDAIHCFQRFLFSG